MTDFNCNILIISGAIIAFAAIIVGLILLYKIGRIKVQILQKNQQETFKCTTSISSSKVLIGIT